MTILDMRPASRQLDAMLHDTSPPIPRPATAIDWRHLLRMTDDCGLLEHATGAVPNRRHGYCTDDNGRALAVVAQAGNPHLQPLAERYLAFLEHAHNDGGSFALRMTYERRWRDDISDDASGRAIFGLGVAAARAPWGPVREGAQSLFDRAMDFRSPFPRSMAYASLGAAAVVQQAPDHRAAHDLLDAARPLLVPPSTTTDNWPWPEDRLTYSNALLPNARLAIAQINNDAIETRAALEQLDWLVGLQLIDGYLSPIPNTGYAHGDALVSFDQQPIELWHLADAAARAWHITQDDHWSDIVAACQGWFDGANTLSAIMFDPYSGGIFDGLGVAGPNCNQGAESTLAGIGVALAEADVRQRQPRDGAKI